MTRDPRPLPSGRQFELVHGRQRVVVVEVGGGLRRYTYGEWEVLDGYGDGEMCSAGRGQPLLPWPNRLRDGRYSFEGTEHQLPLTEPALQNAIHGLTRWTSWDAVVHDESRLAMRHLLHPQPGYPFTVELSIAYALGEDGLTVQTTAKNLGRDRCPIGIGMHPYLSVGSELVDEASLSAPGTIRLVTDDRQIPVGREAVDDTAYDFRHRRQIGDTKLDAAFTQLERDANGRARVVLTGHERAVALWIDESFDYVMLYTGDSIADEDRRRRSLAVEPMTCAPNAFASGDGLRVLDPGGVLSATCGITPTIAGDAA